MKTRQSRFVFRFCSVTRNLNTLLLCSSPSNLNFYLMVLVHSQVAPLTSSHTKICLKSKGLKLVSGYGYGDHYITIKIKMPKSLTPEQKELLTAYAELEKDTPGTIFGIAFKKDGK